jgi:hypothetical protein
MALFTAASFPGVASYPAPAGQTTMPRPSDVVSLTLSDGSTVVVFDAASTGLLCMEYMRQRNQWMLQVNDDVAIISVGACKLLVCEMTLINQKLWSSFAPAYMGGKTVFLHRTLSQTLSLDDALSAVGFAKLESGVYAGNSTLSAGTSPPRIKLVDWYFKASPTSASDGSVLNDAAPIAYDYTP